MDARRQLYWDMHDFSHGHGLEVGPLNRPLVGADEGDVSYVDVFDRERIVEHYRGDQNVDPASIPDIDFFLIDREGQTRTLAEAVKAGAPFDWVIASHVIEHVPNVVGWLAELADVVTDGGALVLAVPDRRYCFDAHRPPTTVGQLIGAHYADDRRPTVATVYDHFAGAVDYTLEELWRGEVPTLERRIHSPELTLAKVEEAIGGDYVDSHVWLFSPSSFVRQMHELRELGLSSWIVERVEPTPHGDLEFRVLMRRLPRGADTRAHQHDEVLPSGVLPEWLSSDTTSGRRIAELEGVRDRLQRRRTRLERQIAVLESRLDQKNRRLRRLRRQLLIEQSRGATRPLTLATVARRARARLRRGR